MHYRLRPTLLATTLALSLLPLPTSANNLCFGCSAKPSPPLVVPQQLLPYRAGTYYDYRPAINAASTKIVFEREVLEPNKSTKPNQPTTVWGPNNLYIADLATFQVTQLAPLVPGSARPDWCWRSEKSSPDGLIAFSQGNYGPVYVTKPTPGASLRLVGNTANSIYPAWYPGCDALALDALYGLVKPPASGQSNTPPPEAPTTRKVDAATGHLLKNVTGPSLYAGFPSVNRQDPRLIAFAGQQFDLHAPSATCKTGYDQDCNYVYIADNSTSPPRVAPLDPKAPTNMYDGAYQGRAPSWSPDGKWIAFESNRNCIKAPVSSDQFYQIFIQDSQGNPARPVTDCKYDGQHAKWYSKPVQGRTRLIVTVLASPTTIAPASGINTAPRKISYLDVTDFVTK